MRRLGLLVAVGIVVLATCAAPARDSRTATTLAAPATRDLNERVDEARLLAAWLNSEERALAIGRWRANVEAAMNDYLLDAFNTRQIPSGDCPISRSGVAINCDLMDSYNSEIEEAFGTGVCADYLVEVGCRPMEHYTEHVRERWYRNNG